MPRPTAQRGPQDREHVPVSELAMPRGTHRLGFQLDRGTFTAPTDETPARLEGHAAVFDVLSEEMFDLFGSYRVRITAGAFTDVLSQAPDTRLLINHNPDLVLARTVSKTLTLTQDDHGLQFTAEPADTSYARDLRVVMDRGDVNQCSFAFEVAEDAWIEEQDQVTWEIRSFGRLDDVAVVTYPAFPQTSARVKVTQETPPARLSSAIHHRRLAIAAAQSHRRTA